MDATQTDDGAGRADAPIQTGKVITQVLLPSYVEISLDSDTDMIQIESESTLLKLPEEIKQ